MRFILLGSLVSAVLGGTLGSVFWTDDIAEVVEPPRAPQIDVFAALDEVRPQAEIGAPIGLRPLQVGIAPVFDLPPLPEPAGDVATLVLAADVPPADAGPQGEATSTSVSAADPLAVETWSAVQSGAAPIDLVL